MAGPAKSSYPGTADMPGGNRRIRSAFRFFLSQPLIIVGCITLLGALLRAYHLGFKSLWLDEGIMYWVSRGSFNEVLAQNAAQQSSPPLFALLLNLVSRIGDSEVILRSISWFAGVVAIPATYVLSRQFSSKNAAYFCAFVVAIAPLTIQYSQQAREYSVTFLLAVLMLVFFYRYQQQQNVSNGLGLALSWILGVFCQYGLGLLVVALNGAMAVRIFANRNRKAPIVKWILLQSFILAAVAVVYQVALGQQLAAWPNGPGASATSTHLGGGYWNGTLASFAQLAIENTYRIFSLAYPNPFLLLFVFSLGLFKALGERNTYTALLMLILPMLVTFIAACLRLYPYAGVRQDIFLVPMLYVFGGFGFDYLLSIDLKRVAALTFLVIFALGGLGATFRYLQSPEPGSAR